ncbi:MAG: hypothetical protein ACRDSM_16850 [Pseudonocardiaceae bacterium]
MINHLIQVPGKSAASGTNSTQIPTRAPNGVSRVVFGDELLASSGADKAG